ncbi:hypothetical protein ES708_21903 [subsurface metagenome]
MSIKFFLTLEEFKEELSKASSVLYLADNAGETLFDKVLIEELSIPVTYVVKYKPAGNDALYEDAIVAGIDKIAMIITNGTEYAGTFIDCCSDKFLKEFNSADMIISKGMANYSSLKDMKAPIFFLLRVKCDAMAKEMNTKKDSTVLMRCKNFKPR